MQLDAVGAIWSIAGCSLVRSSAAPWRRRPSHPLPDRRANPSNSDLPLALLSNDIELLGHTPKLFGVPARLGTGRTGLLAALSGDHGPAWRLQGQGDGFSVSRVCIVDAYFRRLSLARNSPPRRWPSLLLRYASRKRSATPKPRTGDSMMRDRKRLHALLSGVTSGCAQSVTGKNSKIAWRPSAFRRWHRLN